MCYPVPTSKGYQVRDRSTTYKGASQQQTLIISKNIQVAAKSKGEQEPISARTRSRIASSAKLPHFKAIQPLVEPVAARTRSITFYHNSTTTSHLRALAAQLLTHLAYLFLYHDTGKQLDYGQLRKHAKFQETWNKSFTNKMGRLYQGFGKGKNGLDKRLEVPNTFNVIRFEDIPKDRQNKICYTSVVCEVIPGKKDPNRTRIKICGKNVY